MTIMAVLMFLFVLNVFWGLYQSLSQKQASKEISVDHMAMLPLISDSFCYGIYKDYNHRKSGLTLK